MWLTVSSEIQITPSELVTKVNWEESLNLDDSNSQLGDWLMSGIQT